MSRAARRSAAPKPSVKRSTTGARMALASSCRLCVIRKRAVLRAARNSHLSAPCCCATRSAEPKQRSAESAAPATCRSSPLMRWSSGTYHSSPPSSDLDRALSTASDASANRPSPVKPSASTPRNSGQSIVHPLAAHASSALRSNTVSAAKPCRLISSTTLASNCRFVELRELPLRAEKLAARSQNCNARAEADDLPMLL